MVTLALAIVGWLAAENTSLRSVECGGRWQEVEKRTRFCAEGGEYPVTAVPVRVIAERFAPVLWFSPDEPLLNAGFIDVTDVEVEKRRKAKQPECALAEAGLRDKVTVPHPLPGDPAPPDQPVVYYQLDEVKGQRITAPSINLTLYKRLHVRYFFYYRCDSGANAHVHDLESADFRLAIETSDEHPGCRSVRLEKVTGYAHALRWVYNRLQLEPGDRVHLPLTILVEEGKHASSPDRNGDGLYTPGYDVNVHVDEAWGIRDNFGSGLLTVKFAASDTKPRHAAHRVVPPSVADDKDPLSRYYLECGSPRLSRNWGHSYELREATMELKSEVRKSATIPGLDEEGFGRSPVADSFWDDALTYVKHNVSLMARWDAPRDPVVGDKGVKWPSELSLTAFGVPLPVRVWVAPRVTFALNGPHPRWQPQRGDVLLMPTASRWVDTYISVWGAGRGERPQLLPEAGFRLRLVSKEPPLPLPLHLWKAFPMWGFRIGLRLPPLRRAFGGNATDATRGVRGVRLVFELGGGAF